MADTKGMVQQIIKYADGSETVINYNLSGTVLDTVEVPNVEISKEVTEEVSEAPVEDSE